MKILSSKKINVVFTGIRERYVSVFLYKLKNYGLNKYILIGLPEHILDDTKWKFNLDFFKYREFFRY